MNHLLSILLTAILCGTASAQTIKTLGFNSTNGQVVANTGTNTLRFTNDISFQGGPYIYGSGIAWGDMSGGGINLEEGAFTDPNNSTVFTWGDGNTVSFSRPITFASTTNAATTRTNLGLPLAALTNTSNVTMMRALAGSTNTNQPFSGVFQYRDSGSDDPYTVTVSNGIIVKIEPQ